MLSQTQQNAYKFTVKYGYFEILLHCSQLINQRPGRCWRRL